MLKDRWSPSADTAGDLLAVPFSECSSSLLSELADREQENDSLIGTRVGSWTLVSVLGKGGMGKVYLADRQGDGYEQSAAGKILHLGQDSEQAHARFRSAIDPCLFEPGTAPRWPGDDG